jgi:4-aminobutyrate aminotransferase-like enzyme
LKLLRQLCDRFGLLLILDEIYTGFGRTGAWFACEHEQVVPDLICLGKALSGGFPISACVGRSDLMDRAWPRSHGEALHTSTFLGHPVGCAMALAQIDEISKIIEPSAQRGRQLQMCFACLRSTKTTCRVEARGMGLMAGAELTELSGAPATEKAMKIIKRLLRKGYIVLPEGEHSNVISLTPPLIISKTQIWEAVAAVRDELLSLE